MDKIVSGEYMKCYEKMYAKPEISCKRTDTLPVLGRVSVRLQELPYIFGELLFEVDEPLCDVL